MHPGEGEKIDDNEVVFGLNLSITGVTLVTSSVRVSIMCKSVSDLPNPLKPHYYSDHRVALHHNTIYKE